ncbi:TPA: excinuclease ABC subunit C [Candidatus Gastranaerophilales bacterium HUM_6]|nr:MAG TPA: excinuclease ABC subunit C [Candidatus Gastranaerophilales bacterium HUM_6]DAA93071.1 MAG TPA: excinuclease ABC subunit C [Candidatus Gastranaerophilales bacterium HUM_7]DAB04292.1 MAG TPA: excinuclease ABC subunit C [Candidatus Gastranaerophilales bacterium HUM_12]
MEYYVYILANKNNSTIYIGVTNDLVRRIYEHKNNVVKGFTQKYNVHKLVYFEQTENIENAIIREKQLKNYSRERKEELINNVNPNWEDLYPHII